MTTLTTTLVTTLHGTVHGPAPEHREAAATLPATPVRVDVAELADSVVLLAPGGSLVVDARGAAHWCATADDTSVATVHITGNGHVPADGEEVVCTLQATAPGRTRGHLVDPSGQRHPFEVIVMAPTDPAQTAAQTSARTAAQTSAQASDQTAAQAWGRVARRASRPPRRSWSARLGRALVPAGRAVVGVAVNG